MIYSFAEYIAYLSKTSLCPGDLILAYGADGGGLVETPADGRR